MIRDITIGQYYPAESVIHRLDPRVKLVGTMTFIISLFLHRSFLMYLVAAVFLTVVIKASKVPFRFMIKGLKAIMVLLLIVLAAMAALIIDIASPTVGWIRDTASDCKATQQLTRVLL